MVRLTEDMIVARTRVSDMNHVKKLNCWGAELSDISIIRKLTNVEVLSLSVNTISTLADIQYCKNLQELYIRKNQIPDIGEILWLRDLPRLKNLWLEENPCAEACGPELYRQTVIRNLPQLQKLDNVAVSSEEMAEAMRRGMELDSPGDGIRLQEEPRRLVRTPVPAQFPGQEPDRRNGGGGGGYQQESFHQGRKESIQSPSRRVSNQVFPEDAPVYSPTMQAGYPGPHPGPAQRWEEDGYEETPPGRRRDTRREQEQEQESNTTRRQRDSRRELKEEETTPQSEYCRRFSTTSPTGSRRGATPDDEMRRVSMRDDDSWRGGARSSYSEPGPPYYRGQEVTRSPQAKYEAQAIVDHHYNNTYRQVDQQLESAQQLVAQRRSNSPQRPYPVRPKNRNSNVLSAILCLIKEIDGPSLEVVEMAVRCRMEELED